MANATQQYGKAHSCQNGASVEIRNSIVSLGMVLKSEPPKKRGAKYEQVFIFPGDNRDRRLYFAAGSRPALVQRLGR
jgi:hypothetical protein